MYLPTYLGSRHARSSDRRLAEIPFLFSVSVYRRSPQAPISFYPSRPLRHNCLNLTSLAAGHFRTTPSLRVLSPGSSHAPRASELKYVKIKLERRLSNTRSRFQAITNQINICLSIIRSGYKFGNSTDTGHMDVWGVRRIVLCRKKTV